MLAEAPGKEPFPVFFGRYPNPQPFIRLNPCIRLTWTLVRPSLDPRLDCVTSSVSDLAEPLPTGRGSLCPSPKTHISSCHSLPLPHPRLSIRLWTIKNPRNQAQSSSTTCSSIPIEHARDPVTPAAHSYIPPFRRISFSPSFLYNRQPSHPPDPNRPIRALP